MRSVSIAAREISYAPGLEVQENDQDRTTDIVLDLGARGIPHRRGNITTSSSNFSRAAAIYDSDNKSDWRLLGYAYLYNISTPAFTGSNLDFSYPESNRRYLKLSVINRDDRPITATSAALFGIVRRILFQFDPGKDHYVYLGNPQGRRPQYDIEKISQYVEASSLDRVSAGPVEKNPSFVPVVPPKPPLSERSPYILPVFLGLVVAVLAFLLLQIIKRSKLGSASSNDSNNQDGASSAQG